MGEKITHNTQHTDRVRTLRGLVVAVRDENRGTGEVGRCHETCKPKASTHFAHALVSAHVRRGTEGSSARTYRRGV